MAPDPRDGSRREDSPTNPRLEVCEAGDCARGFVRDAIIRGGLRRGAEGRERGRRRTELLDDDGVSVEHFGQGDCAMLEVLLA